MNLFRSEEHARAWSQFIPESENGLIPLPDLHALFSAPNRRHVGDPDYLSTWYPRRYSEWRAELERQGRANTYWLGPAS